MQFIDINQRDLLSIISDAVSLLTIFSVGGYFIFKRLNSVKITKSRESSKKVSARVEKKQGHGIFGPYSMESHEWTGSTEDIVNMQKELTQKEIKKEKQI